MQVLKHIFIHTLERTHIRITHKDKIPEESLLFPRGEGSGFFLFLLCWVHGPESVPLVPFCLNISFCRPSWQYLSKPLSFSPWGVHVHRDTEKEATCVWPATILTSLFEKMPTTSFFSNYFYISERSSSVPRPSGIESTLFAHLACWQSVFSFFSPVGSVCCGVAEAAFWVFLLLAPPGRAGLWHY